MFESLIDRAGFDSYLHICWRWWVLEGRCIHKDGAVIIVNVIQKWCERLVQAAVSGNITVAGGLRGHPKGQPALGGVANGTLLATHTIASADQSSCPNNQRELQNQLLAARDVDVNLTKRSN